MAKNFLVESEIVQLPWKLTYEKKKVLNYECFGAELKEGNEITTAYFSTEIPFSIGPAIYSGLPGAILAIEKNGVIVIIATSVDFIAGENPIAIDKLHDGKRVSQEEFDEIVKEKTAEYKKNIEAKSKGKRKKDSKK